MTQNDFVFRIDRWTDDGERIVEHVAGAEDFQIGMATYHAARKRWPKAAMTLRQDTWVFEDSRRTRIGTLFSFPWSRRAAKAAGGSDERTKLVHGRACGRRVRRIASCEERGVNGQMFGCIKQLGGMGARRLRVHDNDRAHPRHWPMQLAGRADRRNRDPLLLPPTLRPRIGLRRKTIARNSPRAVQVVPGLLITSRERRLAQFVRGAG